MKKNKMSLWEGVKQGFRKILTFSGRSRRMEFFSYGLFVTLIMLATLVSVFILIDELPPSAIPIIIKVIGGLYIFMMLAVTIRRFQDVGKSVIYPALMIMSIPPIITPFDFPGSNILIVACFGILGLTLSYLFADGKPEPNEYGPSPKYIYTGN